jgi:hypothetical protein
MSDARDPIEEELLPGERVLWRGQPRKNVLFTRGDVFLVPFSLLWFGFAVTALLSGGFAADGGPMSLVFGSFFVLIGSYFAFGRFVYKGWRRGRTFYAVTDRRVIAATRGWRESVQAQFIDQIPTLNRSIRRNGVGTIRFGSGSGFTQALYEDNGLEFMSPYGVSVPTFYDIDEARHVYDLVQRLRRKEPT